MHAQQHAKLSAHSQEYLRLRAALLGCRQLRTQSAQPYVRKKRVTGVEPATFSLGTAENAECPVGLVRPISP